MIPNYQEYQDKVSANLISVVKVGDLSYAIGTKKFDPNTGEQLPDEVVGCSMDEVDEKITTLTKELSELKSFKSFLENTK